MPEKKSIPKRFLKSGKSFIKKLAEDVDKSTFSSLSAFPSGVTFQGKEDKEEIVLLLRQHPAALSLKFLMIFAFLISPVLFFILLGAMGIKSGAMVTIGAGGSLVFILLAISLAIDTFLKWYFTVSIVTDQRIVDVDFINVLFHKFSETQLEQIQDVTHTVGGVMGSAFDYGTVFIQTASTKPEFEFENIPRPRDVQDVLLDLLEMKQKGQI